MTKLTGLSPSLDDSNKYRDADRIEEADSIPLTSAQKNLVEHIEAGIKSHNDRDKVMEWEDIDHRGDSLHDFPTYIKHWESAKPWGWELRILDENGLHTFNLKWKNYKRPRELTGEKVRGLRPTTTKMARQNKLSVGSYKGCK